MPSILMPTVAAASRFFDLSLPDLALVHGGVVRSHRARGWWWSREGDTPETNAISKIAVEWIDEFQQILAHAKEAS